MEYKLKIGDRVVPVSVKRERGEYIFDFGGKIVTAGKAFRVGPHLYFEAEKERVILGVIDTPDGKEIMSRGRVHLIGDADRLERKTGKKGAAVTQPTEVTPPMPAIVTGMLVEAGDRVKEKQPVAVVSAMKMETTLYAPYDGTVIRVNASAGDKVMPGDLLVELEEIAEGSDSPEGSDDSEVPENKIKSVAAVETAVATH